MKFKLLSIIILLLAPGCKRQEVDGIKIGETLYVHQNFKANQVLRSLILHALKNNSQALAGIIDFPCGGGAGCYDLGILIVDIIYRLGEAEFTGMAGQLSADHKRQLRSLISAGLQYGDFNADGKSDFKRIEVEFPILHKRIIPPATEQSS